MAGRHVFITGATGFVGSWLADHFASAGEIVTALVNEVPVGGHFDRCVAGRVNMVYGSVLDASLLNRVMADRGIDTVFHCAAVSTQPLAQRHPFEAFEVNVRGTYTLLEACRINLDVVRRVVVASSDKVYGDSDDLPYLEQHPLLGLNPYDASKCCADVIARSYHHGYGLPVVVGRFGNIYGGADLNWSRLIPGTIRRLMRGESPIMRSSARGEFRRDFLYIDDLVRACSALVEKFDAPGIAGFGIQLRHGTGVPCGRCCHSDPAHPRARERRASDGVECPRRDHVSAALSGAGKGLAGMVGADRP